MLLKSAVSIRYSRYITDIYHCSSMCAMLKTHQCWSNKKSVHHWHRPTRRGNWRKKREDHWHLDLQWQSDREGPSQQNQRTVWCQIHWQPVQLNQIMYALLPISVDILRWTRYVMASFFTWTIIYPYNMSEIETLHVKEDLQYVYEIVFSTNCDIISVFL